MSYTLPLPINPITLCDGYKVGHEAMYPVGMEFLFSNFTARGSRIEGSDGTIFFGLQYFLREDVPLVGPVIACPSRTGSASGRTRRPRVAPGRPRS